MPEGDTVHKIALALRPLLQGERIVSARTRRRDEPSLVGCRVTGVSSHGKHLLLTVDDGRSLRSHLGMYGSWHRYRRGERWQKPPWQASLVLETATVVVVCFNASAVEILEPGGARRMDLFRRVGPDLLADGVVVGDVVRRAREFLEPDTPLVDVLLDQRVASGIGNVYKSELLFMAGRPPMIRLQEIEDPELQALYQQARQVLIRNLGGGPRTTRFVADGRGRLWVYGRAGRACFGCENPIRHDRLGRHVRPTYWCGVCQRSA